MALDREKTRRILAEKMALEDVIARIFLNREHFFIQVDNDLDGLGGPRHILIDGSAPFSAPEWHAIRKVITARADPADGEAGS